MSAPHHASPHFSTIILSNESFLYFKVSKIFKKGNNNRSRSGGSRGTSNNCVGKQNSSYLLRKTKLTGVRRTLNPPRWSERYPR